MKKAILPLLIFSIILSFQNTHARIVEVSSYEQIRDACLSALPNDTIIIAEGVYTISDRAKLQIIGRPGPVLVRGVTGNPEDVIIQGYGVDDDRMSINFELENCPDWTFESLTTRNSYFHGFKFDLGSTDCTLRNVVMMDHGESGVKGSSNPAVGIYPDRLLVEDCLIGFTLETGGKRPNVEGVDGVGVNDWIIRGTTFINIQRNGQPAYACFTKGNSSGTIIENCVFINCLIGASFGGGGSSPNIYRDNNREFEHRGGIIRNNIFIRGTDAAIYINQADSCKIYNNTVFECIENIQIRFPESSAFVRNNLVIPSPVNPDAQTIRSRDGGVFLANEGNLKASYSDFVKSSGRWQDLILSLSTGSPAIDAGVEVGADVEFDFDWNARPVGGNQIDVGAYEFCKTSYFDINILACDQYEWEGGIYTESGTYGKLFENYSGCDSIFRLILTIPDIDTSITVGDGKLIANAEFGIYQWLDCENNYQWIEGANEKEFAVLNAGVYALEIEQSECKDTSSCYTVYPSSLSMTNDIIIHTVQNTDLLIINISEKYPKYEISNIGGAVVLSGRSNRISLAGLERGIYFIRVSTGKQVFYRKIIKV